VAGPDAVEGAVLFGAYSLVDGVFTLAVVLT
jgi:hypothetical protein